MKIDDWCVVRRTGRKQRMHHSGSLGRHDQRSLVTLCEYKPTFSRYQPTDLSNADQSFY